MLGSIISVVDKSTVEIIEPLNFKKHVFITLNIKKRKDQYGLFSMLASRHPLKLTKIRNNYLSNFLESV